MLPTLFLTALLPLASLANPVERSAASIVSSINTINSNIKTLNTTLNTFHKGDLDALAKVLKIQSQTTTLGKSIDSGTSTAQSSAKLNGDDSFKVATAVLGLQPNVISLLQNLENHKPAFDAAVLGFGSVTPQVEKDLKAQNTSTAAFSKAVTAKLADPYPSLAGTVTGPIFAKFNEAITLFSKSGGIISVPPLFPTKE